jgi:hypothetical protein
MYVKAVALVWMSPTDCGVSLRVSEKPREWGGPDPIGAVAPPPNVVANSVMLQLHL